MCANFQAKRRILTLLAQIWGDCPITWDILVLITLRVSQRTGWRLKWGRWRWEELGGGGWTWVEVGSKFSNTLFKKRLFKKALCRPLCAKYAHCKPLFPYMLIFREPYQDSKYLAQQTNRHPLQVVRVTMWNRFPENKLEHSSKNVYDEIPL